MINLLSICCTFRRPKMLKNMLESYYATRSKGSEMIIYLHLDDPFLEEYSWFINDYPHILDRHRSLQEVINHITMEVYPGIPYYQIITDDAIYHTEAWDLKLMEAFKRGSNGWGFCCGYDGSNSNWYAYEHPSMEIWSWKQAKTLGYVWPRYFEHQGIDFYTKDLAKEINGLVHVPEVFIEHLYWGGCGKKELIDDNIKEAYSAEAYGEAHHAFVKWKMNDKANDVQKIRKAQHEEAAFDLLHV